MQKELNPELFGESIAKSRVLKADQATPAVTHTMIIETKINETRQQMHQLAESLANAVTQVNEFIKSSQNKFERLQQAIVRLEQNDQVLNTETAQRLSHINNRMGERKVMDMKIQEMIDRHNSVLKSYEVRFNQLQKLLADKEAMLVSAQSALNETKMEISRLKRL